jgi:hypothetical protein
VLTGTRFFYEKPLHEQRLTQDSKTNNTISLNTNKNLQEKLKSLNPEIDNGFKPRYT